MGREEPARARYGRLASLLRGCGVGLLLIAVANAAPPRVVDVTPPPAEWIVDGRSLDAVTLSFDTPVIVPPGAVTVRTLSRGRIWPVSVTPSDTPAQSITIAFPPVQSDRATLIIDHRVANVAGERLDGEVPAPHDPHLPSGNGLAGGSAVFRFSVLQGDINRDGLVDAVDFSLLGAGTQNFDRDADLNNDGYVNGSDEEILLGGAGTFIQKTDGIPPLITGVSPADLPLPDQEITVRFSEAVDPVTVTMQTVHLVGEDGRVLTPTGPPLAVDVDRFAFPFDDLTCGQDYTVNTNNAISDYSGELLRLDPPTVLSGEDDNPPDLACPALTFANSTDPFSIAADHFSLSPEVQELLRSAYAEDECTSAAGIRITSSLDSVPSLPLGVNTVTFTATDSNGNQSRCESTLIVVPAVPLEGDSGEDGQDGADGLDGPEGPAGSAGAPGKEGEPGPAGRSCWDLNENGMADGAEDLNDDGMVNVLDCRGDTERMGADPSAGRGDSSAPTNRNAGPDPEQGLPLPDGAGDVRSPRPTLCGAIGMIPLLFCVLGMALLRFRC